MGDDARRHHRAAAGARGRHRRDRAARARRRGPRHRRHPRPRLLPVDARRRPRDRHRLRAAAARPGAARRARARTRTATRSRSPTRSAATASPPARSPASTPRRASPIWLQRRLQKAGHAADLARRRRHQLRDARARPAAARLRPHPAPRADRRAPGRAGREAHHPRRRQARRWTPRTCVITDDRGPIGLAGVMGGADTEIADADEDTHHRGRHRGRALRRDLDRPHGPPAQAALRGVQALRARRRPAGRRRRRPAHRRPAGAARGRHRRRRASPRSSRPSAPRTITIPADHPDQVAGVVYGRETVVRRLQQVGCDVYGHGRADRHRAVLAARPDRPERPRRRGHPAGGLREPALHAAQAARRPRPHRPRSGCTAGSAARWPAPDTSRRSNYPFIGEAGLRPARPGRRRRRRRRAVKLANPLSDEEPALRTTLLPGLLGALRRNDGRGSHDLALFETGLVFRPREERARAGAAARRPPSHRRGDRRRSTPRCPTSRATSPSSSPGAREQAGWWGKGRPADWADAIEAARTVAREAGVELDRPRRPARAVAPGPLRRAASSSTARSRSSATPASCTRGSSRRSACPPRTCAMELDLDVLEQAGDGAPQAPQDLHLPGRHAGRRAGRRRGRPAADVEAALRDGAGELLESLRLFDVFTGEQVGDGQEVAGVRAALPCRRPHADRRGGLRRPRRGGGPGRRAHRRGAARRLTAPPGVPGNCAPVMGPPIISRLVRHDSSLHPFQPAPTGSCPGVPWPGRSVASAWINAALRKHLTHLGDMPGPSGPGGPGGRQNPERSLRGRLRCQGLLGGQSGMIRIKAGAPRRATSTRIRGTRPGRSSARVVGVTG